MWMAVLDEAAYDAPPITGFLQIVPLEGEPATERTDAWVFFDDDNIYLVCRCWDSAPPEEWVANEMRRDSQQVRQNDLFGAIFDTFQDRRNGFSFYTNPLAARADQWITDEGNPNRDWNPVWSVRTGRFEGGWTAEMAIPFKSLRYLSRRGSELGNSDAAPDSAQKRDGVSRVRSAFSRCRDGHFPPVGGCGPGRPGSTSGGKEHRESSRMLLRI